MCLIMVGPSAKIREMLLRNSAELLENVYQYNGDGFGVMYNTTGGVRAVKILPKTLAKLRKFVESLPNDNREIALHARMQTHGLIDKENCHPYAVNDGFMMHNGVLSDGNKGDVTKSDTWHFCRDFLDGNFTPAVHSQGMHRLLSDYITDNNRFVLLTANGQMSVVNKDTGVTHEGVWFSNEYAWDVGIVDKTYSRFDHYSNWLSDKKGSFHGITEAYAWSPTLAEWQTALVDGDVQALNDYLDGGGVEGLLELFDDVECVEVIAGQALGAPHRGACEALRDQDLDMLERIIEGGPAGRERLAECMAYFTKWESIDFGEEDGGDYSDLAGRIALAEDADIAERTFDESGHIQEQYAG